VSSFEEVRVQTKLVKGGEIEMVETPRFKSETRKKELERRQGQNEESTPEGNSRCFLIIFTGAKSRAAAAAIQHPAVEQ